MKTYLYWLPVLGSLAVCQAFSEDVKAHPWGAMTNSVQMSISLRDDGKEVKIGQPLALMMRIKSLSTNETFTLVLLNEIERDPGFSFIIVSPSGRDISPKPSIGSGSGHIGALAPGQTVELKFDLASICRFDEVGTYKIIAKREVLAARRNRVFEVVSNPLGVPVVPDP